MSQTLPVSSDLTGTWTFIQPSLGLILGAAGDQGVTSKMYMNCYTAVYNYCTNKSSHRPASSSVSSSTTTNAYSLAGAEIYAKTVAYLIEFITNLKQEPTESFLQFYVRTWKRFTIGAGYLNNVFDYMNRYWVQKERSDGRRDVYDVSALCTVQWKTHMFLPNAQRLIDEILVQIEMQRNNEIVDTTLISIAIKSLVYLGIDLQDTKKNNLVVYITYFENSFLAKTEEYYRSESDLFLSEHNVVDYMKKCETRIMEEISRSNNYLEDHTKKCLVDTLNKVLIEDHAQQMYDQFLTLLEYNETEHIQRMYKLLGRVPTTLQPLANSLEDYIKNNASKVVDEIVKASESLNEAKAPEGKAPKKTGVSAVSPKIYVHKLIAVYRQFSEVVDNAFSKDPIFIKSLDNACRFFVNKNRIAIPSPKSSSKTPEILARYADTFLKSSAKEAETYDMNANNLLTLFKFVDEKDAFEENYRRMLAKRLINDSSKSEELEESVIKRLQDENSLEYTQKMSKMFTDMKASEDLKNVIRDKIAELDPPVKEFQPLILASSTWPFAKNIDYTLNIPPDLQPILDKLEEIYTTNHSGRILEWLWNHGRCEVKANLSRKGKAPFLFTVTNTQMLILYAFNKKKTYTFAELHQIVGSAPHVLESQILPFTKFKLLEQNPPGSANVGKPNTSFTIVDVYVSKKLKVNFVSSLKSEQKKEEEATQKEILDSRKAYLDACIVRTMKARKVMKHNELTNEVITQSLSRFQAKPLDVKKAIGALILKEYLKRVDNDTYEYVA